MFVRISAPATPFQRTRGWEYATLRTARRNARTRNAYGPTSDVIGPVAAAPNATRFPDTYAARSRPIAAKAHDARKIVSRSMSPSPMSSSTTWTYFFRGFARSVVPMS